YKPIIAAVGGPAVAGGMEMLGGVDIRIATPDATFGVMEPKRGLFAGGGTTANAPLAVQATKESVLKGLLVDLEEAYKIESQISGRVFQTEDAKEGPKAFAEKRPPVWQGK